MLNRYKILSSSLLRLILRATTILTFFFVHSFSTSVASKEFCEECNDDDLLAELMYSEMARTGLSDFRDVERQRSLFRKISEKWSRNGSSTFQLSHAIRARTLLAEHYQYRDGAADINELYAISRKYKKHPDLFVRARALQALIWAEWNKAGRTPIPMSMIVKEFGDQTERLLELSWVDWELPTGWLVKDYVARELSSYADSDDAKLSARAGKAYLDLAEKYSRGGGDSELLYSLQLRFAGSQAFQNIERNLGETDRNVVEEVVESHLKLIEFGNRSQRSFAKLFVARSFNSMYLVRARNIDRKNKNPLDIEVELPRLHYLLNTLNADWNSDDRAVKLSFRILASCYCAFVPIVLAYPRQTTLSAAFHKSQSARVCNNLSKDNMAGSYKLNDRVEDSLSLLSAINARTSATP